MRCLVLGKKRNRDLETLGAMKNPGRRKRASVNKIPRTLGDETRQPGSCTGLHVWIGSLIRGLMLDDDVMKGQNPSPSGADISQWSREVKGPAQIVDHGWTTDGAHISWFAAPPLGREMFCFGGELSDSLLAGGRDGEIILGQRQSIAHLNSPSDL